MNYIIIQHNKKNPSNEGFFTFFYPDFQKSEAENPDNMGRSDTRFPEPETLSKKIRSQL